jgi:uncharacterized phosphosugar-binding protein
LAHYGLIVEMMVCAIVEKIIADGKEPFLLQSSNIDGAEERNFKAIEQLEKQFSELLEVFSLI